MLIASSSWVASGAALHTTFLLGRRVRAHVVHRHGLSFDTRYFVGGNSASAKSDDGAVVTIHCVLRGALSVNGGELRSAPLCHVLPESQFERVDPCGLTFRMDASPASSIDLCVPASLAARERIRGLSSPCALDAQCWDALARLSCVAQSDAAAALGDVLRELERCGVVVAGGASASAVDEAEAEHLVRLWRAIAVAYEKQDTAPVRKELATRAGISLRQLARDLAELDRRAGLYGWRETTRVLRLRRAVLLLTAPSFAVHDVARAVGYGSVDAMTRAFRDARLPTPTAVRASILAAFVRAGAGVIADAGAGV